MSERDQTPEEYSDDSKIDELVQGIEVMRKQQILRHKRMTYDLGKEQNREI